MQAQIAALSSQFLEFVQGSRRFARDSRAARFLTAIVLAPLAPVLVSLIRTAIENPMGDHWSMVLLALVTLASYGGLYLVGLPGLRFLHGIRCLGYASAAVLGMAGGMGTFALLGVMLALAMDIRIAGFVASMAWAGVLGMSLTLSFVLIAGIPAQQGTGADEPRAAQA